MNATKWVALWSAATLSVVIAGCRGRSQSHAASHAVATIFNGREITALQEAVAKQEWDLLRHRLGFQSQQGDEQATPLAGLLGLPAESAIDANHNTFLVLVEEAHNLGINVSKHTVQDFIHSRLVNFPDETDEAYDISRKAVDDILLVRAMLDRVSDTIKVSQPAQTRMLALTQQDVAIVMAQLSAKSYLAATSGPTEEQIMAQYDRYRALPPGQITDDNPLGFGYRLPDRVKLQFIGFRTADLRDHVKASRSLIEWQALARRLYRAHPSDFPVATAAPATEMLVVSAPGWESLPPEVKDRVYTRAYDAATDDLRKNISEWVSDQLAADYAGYRDALSKRQPAPATSNGSAFDSDDYLRRLAAAARDQFGVLPVLGFISNGWKSADDLALLDSIGPAFTKKGQTFGQYSTTAGAEFAPAAPLDQADRLALWQPSQPLYVGSAADPTEFYFFRLTGMDPSHPPPPDDARDAVIADLRIEQAWATTLAEANALIPRAREIGVPAAAAALSPAPTIITTGLFNVVAAQNTGQITGLSIQPEQIRELTRNIMELMKQPSTAQHPATVVKFPSDRTVALVELTKVQANWSDAAERLRLQAFVAAINSEQYAEEAQANWCDFDNAARRTGFKEIKSP